MALNLVLKVDWNHTRENVTFSLLLIIMAPDLQHYYTTIPLGCTHIAKPKDPLSDSSDASRIIKCAYNALLPHERRLMPLEGVESVACWRKMSNMVKKEKRKRGKNIPSSLGFTL